MNPLIRAIDNEDINAMKWLLNAGYNINATCESWFGEFSLLMHALTSKKYNAAYILIEAGADVGFVNSCGMSAIKIVANEDGPLEMVNLLIENGATLDTVDSVNYWEGIPDPMLLYIHNNYRSYWRYVLGEFFDQNLIPFGDHQNVRHMPQDILNDIVDYL